MKRIIVPTDFSKTAWNATLHALEYANILNAEVVILHVFEEPHGGATSLLSLKEQMRSDSDKELLMIRNELDKIPISSDLIIQTISMYGDLTNVLSSYVNTSGEDIIVMGTQGNSNFIDKLFGSNTSNVVKHVDCPIIVIPPQFKFNLSHGIACAISDFVKIQNSDIRLLKSIVDCYAEPILKLLHITTEEEAMQDNIVLPFNEFDTLNTEYNDLIGDDIPKMLENYTLKEKLNCLVLLRKDRNFIERLFHKGVSSEIIADAYVPLLILRSE